MEIIVLRNIDAVADKAAQWVHELMAKKPDAVLGFATGSTPIALYERLVELYRAGELSLKDAVTFNLDEYLGISPESRQSYRSFMNAQLFDHVDIAMANTHLPACSQEDNPREVGAAYEQKILQAGGIDLQILGIGANGHIGFNEPTSSLASRTRIQALTERTVKDNSRLFDPGETQPRLALTMGIATILEARHILLLATGEHKAAAVRKVIEGPLTAMCPGSALQMHQNTVMILDEAAARDLESVDYYRWVYSQQVELISKYGHFADVNGVINKIGETLTQS